MAFPVDLVVNPNTKVFNAVLLLKGRGVPKRHTKPANGYVDDFTIMSIFSRIRNLYCNVIQLWQQGTNYSIILPVISLLIFTYEFTDMIIPHFDVKFSEQYIKPRQVLFAKVSN